MASGLVGREDDLDRSAFLLLEDEGLGKCSVFQHHGVGTEGFSGRDQCQCRVAGAGHDHGVIDPVIVQISGRSLAPSRLELDLLQGRPQSTSQ